MGTLVYKTAEHRGEQVQLCVTQEREDNRREKQYAAKLRVSVQSRASDRGWWENLHVASQVRDKVSAHLQDTRAVTSKHGVKAYAGETLTVRALASKPSEICLFTQEEAEWVGEVMLAAAKAELDRRADAKLAEELIGQARYVAQQIAARATEKAKERINYDARLAGLRAELKATQERALTEACEWARESSAKLAEPVPPKVLEAACKHASEVMLDPGDYMAFGTGKQAEIKPEEVLP